MDSTRIVNDIEKMVKKMESFHEKIVWLKEDYRSLSQDIWNLLKTLGEHSIDMDWKGRAEFMKEKSK